jgi:hypothetical protein
MLQWRNLLMEVGKDKNSPTLPPQAGTVGAIILLNRGFLIKKRNPVFRRQLWRAPSPVSNLNIVTECILEAAKKQVLWQTSEVLKTSEVYQILFSS